MLDLILTALSGGGLIILELYAVGIYWLFSGKGLMALVKLAILLLIRDHRPRHRWTCERLPRGEGMLDRSRHACRASHAGAAALQPKAGTVFAWPGVGRLAYEAVIFRDYPLLQAVVILKAVIVLGINLVIDILYAYVDPRIRYG